MKRPSSAGRDSSAEPSPIEAVIAEVKTSRKYRDVHEEAIRLLTQQAYADGNHKPKALSKAVRRRLHGIVATHLGDPDYVALGDELAAALQANDRQQEQALCEAALQTHLSTRERLPYLSDFYGQVFECIGLPQRLLDLACGLGPLALPWMGLPASSELIALDIHESRVALLDSYLRLRGQAGTARVRDIVLQPPDQTADAALLLKELHRLQRNYPGVDADWLATIPARHLVISLPAVSAHGGRRLVDRYRHMMDTLLDGRNWIWEELLFPHEVVFCIDTGVDHPNDKP